MELTKNQKQILSSLKEEFKKINKEQGVVKTSIIDELFQQANQYNIERKEFYDNIESINSNIVIKRDELLNAFYNKLVNLFSNYKQILVFKKGVFISMGINLSQNNEKPTFKNGWFSISGGLTYVDARLNNAEKRVSKYTDVRIGIDNNYLSLEDFETTAIFKKKVTEMFKSM